MSSAGHKAKAVEIPRPSASLVVVNERNEVLLVQRNPQASAFGGFTVFPGGNYDEKQDDSFQLTAIRETFEESGLIIASPQPGKRMPSDSVLDEARQAIHSLKLPFKTFLDRNGLEADTDSLLPFTQWITPKSAPRRFHARFFVSFLPSASSLGFTSGNKQERLPKPDGGLEVINARFVHPDTALEEYKAGKIAFMPPQYYILDTLSGILRGDKNSAEQRAKVRELAYGKFGRMVIHPLPMKGDPNSPGQSILVYEGDETRGGSKGRIHRAILQNGKRVTDWPKIELQRNFDIFTEIEDKAFHTPSKL